MQQEYRYHYGDRVSTWQANKTQLAPYLPQEVSNAEFGRQPVSRPVSPVRQPVFEESQSQSRRGSHASSIALSFQIPRSVNDSGGSLSELAAEISYTSSRILRYLFCHRDSLSRTPRPTTGFRKWVTTILSTTLVAQNVVLLALLFVYRLKKLNPMVKGKPGSEYRLLTVALMLGNKFLDDNTYTNKTWAEVSGINVGEVHIMEVEFLSNMKYCLFTSAEDWTQWQSLLGRFASFFERASKPYHPAPILPPASSVHLAMPLPSPPSSNQASPPHFLENRHVISTPASLDPTPAPSPLHNRPTSAIVQPSHISRKRVADDHVIEPSAKRVAGVDYTSPHPPSVRPASAFPAPVVSRLTLPSLSIPASSAPAGYHPFSARESQQLPPMSASGRPINTIYPNTGFKGVAPILTPTVGMHSRVKSRDSPKQQSPFPVSAGTSPGGSSMPVSAPRLHAATQISPNYFLHQRNSPYRPVRNVSTLLYPPPSGALYHRPQNVEHDQMAYQPLGKPLQEQHHGRLPYVAQNVWLEDNGAQAMTPVHQWPGFSQKPHLPHPH